MEKRSRIVKGIRDFFTLKGYLEVDTPILSPHLIPESTIANFKTLYYDPDGKETALYMVPSPEIWMKKIIGLEAGSIYQISKCFRNREPGEGVHNPEFTMLEWYTMESGYLDGMKITEELFASFPREINPGYNGKTFLRLSMEEAFREFADIDLSCAMDTESLMAACDRTGITCLKEDTWEQLFNRLFLTQVEPAIPFDTPVFIYDYPAKVNTLAKVKEGTPWCERWELYVNGVELANCFTEETEKDRVLKYYGIEKELLDPAKGNAPADPFFPDLFSSGYPQCSGVAMGVDRLVMVLLGFSSLSDVVLFPF